MRRQQRVIINVHFNITCLLFLLFATLLFLALEWKVECLYNRNQHVLWIDRFLECRVWARIRREQWPRVYMDTMLGWWGIRLRCNKLCGCSINITADLHEFIWWLVCLRRVGCQIMDTRFSKKLLLSQTATFLFHLAPG